MAESSAQGTGRRGHRLPSRSEVTNPGASMDREPSPVEDEARRDLARMIVFHGYDPSVVENDYFRSFVRRLNPGFEVPSRHAIEEMCDDIFQNHRKDMVLPSQADRPSLAMGKAKFIEAGEVFCITCHFIDDEWNLHRVVMDAYVVVPLGDHYHVPLLGVPVVTLDEAVPDVVGDITVVYDLFMIAGEIPGDVDHIKLKDHVKLKRDKEPLCTTHMDHVLHSIAQCLLPDSEFAEHLFNKLPDYPECKRQDRQELLQQHDLDDTWEYDERWYWCYCSLEILAPEIPQKESESRKLLRSLWGEIYRAIKRVSASDTPTSNLCLEQLFKVRYVLQSQLSGATKAHAPMYNGFGNKNVADVLREANETLDKAIQDSYLVWSIPLVMDPRYKLQRVYELFKSAFDTEKAATMISEVTRKIEELYSGYYSSALTAEAREEMHRYLNTTRVIEESFDILNWWKVDGFNQYPRVAEMARDALAMPTCSKLTPDQIAQVRSMIRGYD